MAAAPPGRSRIATGPLMGKKKQPQPGQVSHWPGQTSHDIGMEFAAKTAEYLTPWVVYVAAGVAAAGAHHTWGGDPVVTPFVALMVAAAGAGLTSLTRVLAHKTGDRVRREIYTANAAALTLGVTVGLVAGMTHRLVLTGWVLVGVGMCLATTIRAHIGPIAAGREGGGKWARVAEKLNLAQFEAKQLTTNGRGVVTGEIEAKDGATMDEFQKKVPALTAAAGLGRGRMTVTEDPEDSSRGQMRAAPVDLLKNPIPWPGPAQPGGSIAAPVRGGLYEDGEEVALTLPGDVSEPGNLEHLLVMGMTGSGKSEEARGVVTDVLTRRDAHVLAVDMSKGQQTFGAIRHGLTLLITEENEAQRFFKTLRQVIRARTDHLTHQGLKGWAPGCGLSFLIIWGEEAADYAADSTEYNQLLRAGRSAGIWIVSSLQRATYVTMSTDARANHGASMCFGVNDPTDADFALPDEVTGAGAIPTWKAHKPGRAYLAGMGAPQERWTVPLRGYKTDDRVLAEVVTRANPYREPLDQVTAHALGAVYTNRAVYTTPLLPTDRDADEVDDTGEAGDPGEPGDPAAVVPARSPSGLPAEPTARAEHAGPGGGSDRQPAVDQPQFEELDMTDEDVAREVSDLYAWLGDIASMDPEPKADYPGTGLEEELPDGDPDTTLTFPTPGGADRDRVRAELENQLDSWARDGVTSFTPNDLKHIWLQLGSGGRRWFYRQRDKLLEAGVIAEPDDADRAGEYDLLRSPHDSDSDGTG